MDLDKKQLQLSKKIRASPTEVQNVLSYAIDHFPKETRLDYMPFAEDICIENPSWSGLLTWWNKKDRTEDKATVAARRRSIERFKVREYNLQ